MKPAPTLKELEREQRDLIHAMRLPDSVFAIGADPGWKHFDLAFARELIGMDQPWGTEDAFDPKNRIVNDVFMASEEGRRLFLASENDLLRQVRESGSDQSHHGPFGICEAIFPVRVRGSILHLVRTGKYLTAPFQEKDLQEIAFLCGVPLKTVRGAVACLPIYSPEQVDDLKRTHAHWRDSIKLGFREHLRLKELTARQLQQERLGALGSLAEGMAHHFSNLHSIILGYSSLLLDRASVREENTDAVRKISEAAQRGRRFTEEILALSDSLADEEPSVCSLHERLQGILTLMESRLRTGIQVETEMTAENDRILAPSGIIHHVAFNAVASAMDSMPDGGRLSLKTENLEQVENGKPVTCLRLTIRETGTPSQDTRQPPSARDTHAGETLAPKMATLLGQVTSLDGTATLRSENDHTIVLEITLPCATGEHEAAPSKRIRRRLAPSRIWVADDDPVVREMCRRVLNEERHEVEEIESGAKFMSRLDKVESTPDLLVYDFSMPDITGLEACQWLRKHEHRLPVILVSGYPADHPEIRKALKLRKTFLLQKPFSFRDMSDLVTIALGETLIEEAQAP